MEHIRADQCHQYRRRQHLRPDVYLVDYGPHVSQVDSVTLTATNASSQQESQTYYFLVPTTTSGSGSGPTWPTTLSPDTVSSSAPSWSGDGVSVNADSGALDTTITLPTYNPNVPASRVYV